MDQLIQIKQSKQKFTPNQLIQQAILNRNTFKVNEEGWHYWNFVIRKIAHSY